MSTITTKQQVSLSSQSRPSRILQPASRLSFVPGPGSSAPTRLSALSSSTFRVLPTTSRSLGEATSVAATPAASTTNHLDMELLPNANTSGLPAPTLRPPGNTSGYPANELSRQSVSPAAMPSTISSALRRRDGVPVVGTTRLSSRLPSPGAGMSHPDSVSKASFGLRRSHSQRPMPDSGIGGQQMHRQTKLNVQLNGIRAAQQQVMEPPELAENDDEPDKCVQSLPPLKSSSYISRLVSKSIPAESLDLSSHSESTNGCRPKTSQTTSPKPSQLVKPLPTKSAIRRKSSLPNNLKTTTDRSTTQSESEHKSSSLKKPGLSMLPAPGKTALVSQVNSNKLSEVSLKAKRLPTLPSRQMSQNKAVPSSEASSTSLKVATQAIENETPNGDSISSEEEDLLEDYEDEGDDDGDDEEDDDATTATSMTQMSGSNTLSSANRELNSMIQMLSSSAILAGSRLTGGSLEKSSSIHQANYESISSSTEGINNRRVKKSQSMSLSSGVGSKISDRFVQNQLLAKASENAKQSSISQLSAALQNSIVSERVNSVSRQLGKQRQQPKTSSVVLPRPRSRVIFDPTSSQFHLSCAEPTGEEYLDDEAQGQTSCDELSSANEDLTSNHNVLADDDDQDEASLKLLHTQSQISALKCLPRAEINHIDSSYESYGQEDDPATGRLRNCRSSLDSLIRSTGNQQAKKDDKKTPEVAPSSVLPSAEESKQRRSPASFALRSLFGLHQPPSSQRNSLHVVKSNQQSTKVATIVRHSSLRSTSRLYSQHELSPDRKLSLQDEAPAKHSNIGSDLLQRASKKLSASSSSLSNKFKFISSSSNNNTSANAKTSTQAEPTEGRASGQSCQHQQPSGRTPLISSKNNVGLPPRMPVQEARLDGCTDNPSSVNSPMTNGFSHEVETMTNNCSNGLDMDTDATIISDSSTIHGDSTSMLYINKCSELERTVGSLKDKLMMKERELTDLQLKQLSSDYHIEQLKSTISKLEKENAQLKSVMVKANRG